MSNFSTVGDWSTTAASNTIIDSINCAENCAMSGLNNAIRSAMAAVKGALTSVATSGGDTYTATLAPAPDALATGQIYAIDFGTANTGTTPTLNLNSLGAKTIVDQAGNAVVAGALNGEHLLLYDGTDLRVLNPVKSSSNVISVADATNGGINVATSAGVVTLNVKPSDLSTKSTPTISDSIVIMDAAASNAAKTATIPEVASAMILTRITSTTSYTTSTGGSPLTLAIAANTLGTTGMLEFVFFGDYTNNTGSNANFRIAGTYGGSTFFDTGTITETTSANARPWILRGILQAHGATNAQFAYVTFTSAGAQGENTTNSFADASSDTLYTNLTVDSTSSQNLVITITQTSNANVTTDFMGGFVRLI